MPLLAVKRTIVGHPPVGSLSAQDLDQHIAACLKPRAGSTSAGALAGKDSLPSALKKALN